MKFVCGISLLCNLAGGRGPCWWETQKEKEPVFQEESILREVGRRDHQRRPGQHSVPQQRQDLGQGECESHQAVLRFGLTVVCSSVLYSQVSWVGAIFFHPVCVCVFSSREAHVTSADRRLWTLRQCVAVVSVWGPKVSSVDRASRTAMERTYAPCC